MSVVKTNIMRSHATMIALITVLCCLLTMYGTAAYKNSGYNCVFHAALVVNAVMFISWLIWAAYVFAANRVLTPMNTKSYKILDGIDFVLFAYWVLAWFVESAIGPWVIWLLVIIWLVSLIIALRDRKSA